MWQVDIVTPNTPLAEFYRLSMTALAAPSISSGVLTPDEAAALIARPTKTPLPRMRLRLYRRMETTSDPPSDLNGTWPDALVSPALHCDRAMADSRDEPPACATLALQANFSRLRRELAADPKHVGPASRTS